MNWQELQENSDDILMQGIIKLKEQKSNNWQSINNNKQGNYLISKNDIIFYIGEGKNLSQRLKQQFYDKTTTFFKNYKKIIGGNDDINSFEVRIIETNLGRKEIEEFGIVNLPTKLNKFQKNKRKKVMLVKKNVSEWSNIQDNFKSLLSEGEEVILKSYLQNWCEANPLNNAGVYLVYNKENQIIYIGESSNLKERYTTHSGTTYFSALRRHIGHFMLRLPFVQIKSKKKNREFLPADDKKVDDYYKECKVRFLPVNFGRFELEEHLIRKYKPLLNRKENK